jgi:hypothetical protein
MHGLVSFKLLYGLCRYALSAFVPPSIIPNLQKNSWRGQAINKYGSWHLLSLQSGNKEMIAAMIGNHIFQTRFQSMLLGELLQR